MPKTRLKSTLRPAGVGAVLLLLGSITAVGQPAPPPPPLPKSAPSPSQNNTTAPSQGETPDQRIQALQQQLGVTQAEMPQWNAFAQAMRDNATSTDALLRQRASAVASMNALDNMKSYAQVVRAYADDTDRLEKAFEALYNVLTDQQKQSLDAIFRREATQNGTVLPALR